MTFRDVRTAAVAAAVALGLAAPAAPAMATVISGTFAASVTTDGPLNPFAVSFSLTFDNAADIADTTAGITLISAPFALTSVLAFNYNKFADRLAVGGSASGVGAGGAGDFVVTFDSVSGGSPTIKSAIYITPTAGGGTGTRGTVTFTPVTTVPEPGTLALLATGALGLGLARRRRPAEAVAAA